MKYIVICEGDKEYEDFETLEDARYYVINEINDNDNDADKFKLLKVSDEYEVVSSKKVLFSEKYKRRCSLFKSRGNLIPGVI